MDKDMDKDKDKDKEGCGEKKQTRSADEKINFSFDEFWNQYDKKRGDRSKLEKKWQSLSDHDRTAIMAYIPQYKKSQPNKAFRKDPATFLNNKSWNDELISSAKNSVQPQEGYFDKQREEMRLAREQQSKKSS